MLGLECRYVLMHHDRKVMRRLFAPNVKMLREDHDPKTFNQAGLGYGRAALDRPRRGLKNKGNSRLWKRQSFLLKHPQENRLHMF